MSYLELEYETWQREECYGMFDYSQSKNIKQHPKIIIRSPGKIAKDPATHKLLFIQSDGDQTYPPNYEPFARIQYSSGHYFIANVLKERDSQMLCSIALSNEGLKLKEGNKIRLGKAQIDLKRLVWTTKNRANHYEMQKQPKIAQKQSIFNSSFYSQKEKASLIETNPACRYCYSKTIDDQNPFIILCSCSGYTKYIHMSCLVQWIRKRSGILQGYPKGGIYCAQAKAFICQVCKQLYRVDRIIRQVFGVDNSHLQEFAVFLVNVQNPLIYVIDLKREENVSIGRNLESGMVINQLSVSRKHCILQISWQKKEIMLTDLHAKFGTVVQINKGQIAGMQEFQKGRTRMRFTKKTKLSFFQKLGFCSLQQNLSNQRRN